MSDYKKYIDITKKIENVVNKYKIEKGLLIIQSLNSDTSFFRTNDEKSIYDLENQINYIFPRFFMNKDESKLLSVFSNNLIGNTIEVPIIGSKISLGLNECVYVLNLQRNKEVKLYISILSNNDLYQEGLNIVMLDFQS